MRVRGRSQIFNASNIGAEFAWAVGLDCRNAPIANGAGTETGPMLQNVPTRHQQGWVSRLMADLWATFPQNIGHAI